MGSVVKGRGGKVCVKSGYCIAQALIKNDLSVVRSFRTRSVRRDVQSDCCVPADWLKPVEGQFLDMGGPGSRNDFFGA